MMSDHPETQYLNLLKRLLQDGDVRIDRTGVGTRALFGQTLRFDLSQGFPVFTTKKIFWKTAFKEMLWMLSGGRNIKELLEQNVRIWTDWPLKHYREATGDPITQEAFEQRILHEPLFAEQWGDLGPVYGWQWRRWGTADGREIDQLSDLVEGLKESPQSRRLLFEGWNVGDLDQMALPPCHKTYQFFVGSDGRLSSALMQRSADAYLGLGWNIANLGLITHLLAQQCGYEPGEIVWFGGDVHLYLNHVEQAITQIEREPRPFPRLRILKKPKDLFSYGIEDFELQDYDPHPHIAADVAV
ncbi:MAG: thymidylate synthase [Gammaproteobacteria bacterium]|nr:thymidylate synthase [Gammaproteobacteria bacterium]NBY23087.1 thymidylate synthase [Gammaproteobacteria bacterium]